MAAAPPDILPPLDEGDRMYAALGYLFWPIIPPLILRGEKQGDPFMRFHAAQARAFGVWDTVLLVLWAGGGWLLFSVLPGLYTWAGGVLFLAWFILLIALASLVMMLHLWYATQAGSGQVFLIPWTARWVAHYLPAGEEE